MPNLREDAVAERDPTATAVGLDPLRLDDAPHPGRPLPSCRGRSRWRRRTGRTPSSRGPCRNRPARRRRSPLQSSSIPLPGTSMRAVVHVRIALVAIVLERVAVAVAVLVRIGADVVDGARAALPCLLTRHERGAAAAVAERGVGRVLVRLEAAALVRARARRGIEREARQRDEPERETALPRTRTFMGGASCSSAVANRRPAAKKWAAVWHFLHGVASALAFGDAVVPWF